MIYKRPSMWKRVMGDKAKPLPWMEQMVEANKKYMQIRIAGFRALAEKHNRALHGEKSPVYSPEEARIVVDGKDVTEEYNEAGEVNNGIL